MVAGRDAGRVSGGVAGREGGRLLGRNRCWGVRNLLAIPGLIPRFLPKSSGGGAHIRGGAVHT